MQAQELAHIALASQLGRNTEAYVDDIVVKSREARTLIEDLGETFAREPRCRGVRNSSPFLARDLSMQLLPLEHALVFP